MVREIEEELGLVVGETDLWRAALAPPAAPPPNGIVDREHHELNLLRDDRPWRSTVRARSK